MARYTFCRTFITGTFRYPLPIHKLKRTPHRSRICIVYKKEGVRATDTLIEFSAHTPHARSKRVDIRESNTPKDGFCTTKCHGIVIRIERHASDGVLPAAF